MLRSHRPLLTSSILLLPLISATGHEEAAASSDTSSSSSSSSSSSMQASSSSVDASSAAEPLHHDMHEDTVKRLHPEHTEYTACKYDGEWGDCDPFKMIKIKEERLVTGGSECQERKNI